jgi:hypothetical protein
MKDVPARPQPSALDFGLDLGQLLRVRTLSASRTGRAGPLRPSRERLAGKRHDLGCDHIVSLPRLVVCAVQLANTRVGAVKLQHDVVVFSEAALDLASNPVASVNSHALSSMGV